MLPPPESPRTCFPPNSKSDEWKSLRMDPSFSIFVLWMLLLEKVKYHHPILVGSCLFYLRTFDFPTKILKLDSCHPYHASLSLPFSVHSRPGHSSHSFDDFPSCSVSRPFENSRTSNPQINTFLMYNQSSFLSSIFPIFSTSPPSVPSYSTDSVHFATAKHWIEIN